MESKFQSTASLNNNPMMASKIARIQHIGQQFDLNKKKEIEKLSSLEEEIKLAKRILDEKRHDIMLRRRVNIDEIAKQEENSPRKRQEHVQQVLLLNPIRLQKMIKAAHLKIENVRNKYNYTNADNNQLKVQIDRLRRELYLYREIKKILKRKITVDNRELKIQKKKTKDKESNMKQEMNIIKQQGSEYQLQKNRYQKEFHSVFQVLEEENRDEKKREKFGVVGQNGQRQRAGSPWQNTVNQELKDEFTSTNKNTNQLNLNWDTTKSGGRSTSKKLTDKKMDAANNLENLKKEVEQHDEIFKKLVEQCIPAEQQQDTKNIDDQNQKVEIEKQQMKLIVQKFEDYEDQKNTLYQHIITMREELEILQKQKKSIDDEIKYYEQLPEKTKKDPKAQKCEKMLQTIKQVRQSQKVQSNKYQKLMININKLKIQIPVVFEKIGCDSEEYTRELGENFINFKYKDIDEGNIIQYLAIMEKRTNDLLQLQSQAFNYSQGKQQNQQLELKKYKAEESKASLSNIETKTIDNDLKNILDAEKEPKDTKDLKVKSSQDPQEFLKLEQFYNAAKQTIDSLKNRKKREKK